MHTKIIVPCSLDDIVAVSDSQQLACHLNDMHLLISVIVTEAVEPDVAAPEVVANITELLVELLRTLTWKAVTISSP